MKISFSTVCTMFLMDKEEKWEYTTYFVNFDLQSRDQNSETPGRAYEMHPVSIQLSVDLLCRMRTFRTGLHLFFSLALTRTNLPYVTQSHGIYLHHGAHS